MITIRCREKIYCQKLNKIIWEREKRIIERIKRKENLIEKWRKKNLFENRYKKL